MQGSNRREALGIGLTLTAAPVAALNGDDAASAEAALMAFLRSFAACDLPAMEAAFAPDATSFNPVNAGTGDPAPERQSLKRAPGMPDGMRRLALTLPKERPGPPYHRPDLINDLMVQCCDSNACFARATFSRISPGDLVQTNGLGWALC
jgi:hypothetical protein